MDYRQKLSLVLLTGAVATTRFVFRSRYLYDLDSVNFALAIQRFDPRVHQPHPPGYFLYICLGRLLNIAFHDANLALVVLSILASCGMAVVVYKMTLDWFGPTAAQFAGIFFLFSPLAWFHGIVALTYIVEAFFSGFLGYLYWHIYGGRAGFVVPAAIVLGVSAGVRPSSLVFLTPLFLFSLRNATPKKMWMGLAALALTLIAWFVPMIAASGGINAYFDALVSLWRMVPSEGTVFNSSPANSIARAFTVLFIYFLTFGAASLSPLGALAGTAPVDPQKKNFTFVWISPALCFFTFGYLKFVNSGYLLLLCAPACMWLGFWASVWYETTARRLLKLTAIGICIAVNVLIFVASPIYCSYMQVRRFEAEIESLKTILPQVASAGDTLILSFDSHFNGFRHAGYYLPGYLTVEYPEAHLKEGPRIFSMHERDTHLVTALPAAPYTRFVLFPLPAGDSYKEYSQKVIDRLPGKSLHTVSVGGREFVTGSISDLPLLFPEATLATKRGVYVPLHPGMVPVNSRSH
jgi:4-amino-4-deoxy-L-arabinose transferase-like glycosyltransferase